MKLCASFSIAVILKTHHFDLKLQPIFISKFSSLSALWSFYNCKWSHTTTRFIMTKDKANKTPWYFFVDIRVQQEKLFLEKKVVLFCTNFLWLQSKKVPNFHKGAIKKWVQNATFILERWYFLSCSTHFCTDFIVLDFSTFDLVNGTYG